MAYSQKEKNELLKKAISLTKTKKLYFIEDIIALLPISKQTFYTWKFDQNDELKALLESNKVSTKLKLRKKWEDSNNATLMIALYKLIASDEERKVLADRIEADINHNGHSTFIKSLIDGAKKKPSNQKTE